jgi:hypothetical protein
VEELAEPVPEESAPKKAGLPPLETGVSDVTRRVKLPPKRKRPAVKKLDDVFSSKEEEEDEPVEPVVAEMDEWEDEAEVSPVGSMAGSFNDEPDPEADGDVVAFETVEPAEESASGPVTSLEELQAAADFDPKPQGELLLEGGPKGRFEGEDPNLVGGEDLDIPPFLRKKK